MTHDNWYEIFISDNVFDNIEYYLRKNNLSILSVNDIDDIAAILHINHRHGVYSDYIMIPRIIRYLGIKVEGI